jgi:hypothetical protein
LIGPVSGIAERYERSRNWEESRRVDGLRRRAPPGWPERPARNKEIRRADRDPLKAVVIGSPGASPAIGKGKEHIMGYGADVQIRNAFGRLRSVLEYTAPWRA